MFLISSKFPARSEQVEHCFLSRTLDRASYQSYCRNISCKMAGLEETLSNFEVRSVIRFLRLQAHHQLKFIANLLRCTVLRSCHGNTFGFGAPPLITAGQHTWVVTALQLGGTGPSSLPALTWHRVIFISADHWRSTWVEGDSQPTVKFSKSSCPGFRRLTLVSSMLG
jgi:hypothetical protein